MKPISIQDDIVGIGEFKTHASRIMRGLREQGRPIVITQHGKPAGVLITPEDFDRLNERERFIAAAEQGLAESDAGLGVDDGELNKILDQRFGPLDPT
jgi:prevent-host-death family protein